MNALPRHAIRALARPTAPKTLSKAHNTLPMGTKSFNTGAKPFTTGAKPLNTTKTPLTTTAKSFTTATKSLAIASKPLATSLTSALSKGSPRAALLSLGTPRGFADTPPDRPAAPGAPSITMVKKIKADGSPCRKCNQVTEKLEKDGLIDSINRFVIAYEADPTSEGMVLAAKHQIDTAPFFLVTKDGQTKVYTMYFQLKKEVLAKKTSAADEVKEIMDRVDLDFI